MLRYTWRDAALSPRFDRHNGFIGQQINCMFPHWNRPGVAAVMGQGVVLGELRHGENLEAICIVQIRRADNFSKRSFFKSDVFMPEGFANRERSDGIIECAKLHVLPYSREFIRQDNPFIRKLSPAQIAPLIEARAYAANFMQCDNGGMQAEDIDENWIYHGPVFNVSPHINSAFMPDVKDAVFSQVERAEMNAREILQKVQGAGSKKPVLPNIYFNNVQRGRDPFIAWGDTPAPR